MADNLPLIPSKSNTHECQEVRSLLRRVFRELDFLPPAPVVREGATRPGDHLLPTDNCRVQQYKEESKVISEREDDIRYKFAQRIAKEPNTFMVHPNPEAVTEVPDWRLEEGLIDRIDLLPSIQQDAVRDVTSWVVQHVLSATVHTHGCGTTRGARTHTRIGKARPRPPPLPPSTPPSIPRTPTQPQYIVCMPSQLEFVNCSVGKLHTKCLILFNVSKFECRLSVSPTKRRELDIEISSFRGLVVTPGASVELKVHFRPMNMRPLKDAVTIRVSSGQTFVVPIVCYVQPPILNIFVPSMNSSIHLSGSDCRTKSSWSASRHPVDVIELGARLLGDVHCARVYLRCIDQRATFFLLTEDAWNTCNINCVTRHGSVVAGEFVTWPCAWRGGGVARACVWCHATHVGVHVASLRVLSHAAITRTLQLVADVLHFQKNHLIIQAHEKDYDICSEDDADCEYYVNLGTCFPHRALSATVLLVNKSPILYNYHWTIRPWGICHCWEELHQSDSSVGSDDTYDTDQLCIGAAEAKRISREYPDVYKERNETCRLVQVKPERDHILPRSTSTIEVSAPDAGGQIGVQRAVLMLILENIPKESFPEAYEPMIVSTRSVETTPIPGVQSSTRELCEVLVAQMEVHWQVVPLQVVVDPPVLALRHSPRVKSTEVRVRSWQLYGLDESRVSWVMPDGVISPPPHLVSTARCATTNITLPLPSLTDRYPETDTLTLVADNEEWKTKLIVSRESELLQPKLRPYKSFFGVVMPGTNVNTTFQLNNGTYQNIQYWCEAYRWLGENPPHPACEGRGACERCKQPSCGCALLHPRKGALADGEIVKIYYDVNAPMHEGSVATLVRAGRGDSAGLAASAALVAYRVLRPRLVLRVMSCRGDNTHCAEGCGVEEGALVRPRRALVVGRRSCCILHLTNVTPLHAAVHFDTPIDGTQFLKIKFIPNDFNVKPYGHVEVRVVLEGVRVCSRRTFVYQALVARAPQPLYLIVDAAVTGVRVSCEVPLEDDFIIISRTQRQANPKDKTKNPLTTEEIFAEEDRKRASVNDNICRCPFEMVYIPPEKRPVPPVDAEEEYCSPLDIVEEPPPLRRVCPCDESPRPRARSPPPHISLQFTKVALRQVHERRITLHNECVVTAQWSTAVRRWNNKHKTGLLTAEHETEDSYPGLSLSMLPSNGVLGAAACATIIVRVVATCWGLYTDQILIQIDKVEPIVLDVWVEAVGTPLLLKSLPHHAADELPTLWMSTSDPHRTLLAKNVTCSELVVFAYLTTQHECQRDVLPFRLYLRFLDVEVSPCACCADHHYEGGEASETSVDMEMETDIEVYLAPDCGPQDTTCYKVSPTECTIAAGECMKWEVEMNTSLHPDIVPETMVLLRIMPTHRYGECWYRPEPPPQLVRLRLAAREGRLQVSCDDVTVRVYALDLPYDSCLRIRKRFCIQNVGNGILDISASTTFPWCLLQEFTETDDSGCGEMQATDKKEDINIVLPPRSSKKLCVEVCVTTSDVWPNEDITPTNYPSRQRSTTTLHLYDDYHVLKSLPLRLDIECPLLLVEPATLDFGFVTDGDSRKSYITVSHTSRTNTMRLMTKWVGSNEFEIWPPLLEVPPGSSSRVYIQYTAVWRRGVSEGSIGISVCTKSGPGPTWCRGEAVVRASPTRDQRWRTPPHDHTDQPQPVPPAAKSYLQR